MKNQMIRLALLLMAFQFIFPLVAGAEDKAAIFVPVIIQGQIGDYSSEARKYEINGTIITLPQDIAIEDQYGSRLTLKHLTSGVRTKVVGEKELAEGSQGTTRYHKVIVFN